MQTTVWADLAVDEPVAKGILWISPDSFQPDVNGTEFFWDDTNKRLYVKTTGDDSGTDAINTNGEVDSYKANGFVMGTVGSPPGFTISTSRGSGLAPAINLDTDPVGLFGAFPYLGDGPVIPKAYYEAASIRYYVQGAHVTNPGGEMRFGTKANNGLYTEWLKVDNSGHFAPLATGTSRLGTASKGFAALTLDYTISATIGAVAINKPAGAGNIALGAASIVVTNSLVTANSLVLAWLMQTDATLTFIKSVIPAAGSFTVTGNANATANCKFGFLVISTDS